MLNVIGTDYCKCRSQCVLVKQFRFIYLLLRFAYSGVLLMTAFLKIYPIPKIRNIPIYRLSYSIEMYRIATPVSWYLSYRQILANTQPYSFLIQNMKSCAEQPFTVYACAGCGQIRSRNFSERRKAALICVPVAFWYLFFCACVECLPHKLHAREWLQCSVHAGALPEKSAEKKEKKKRLPIAAPIYGRSTGASLV